MTFDLFSYILGTSCGFIAFYTVWKIESKRTKESYERLLAAGDGLIKEQSLLIGEKEITYNKLTSLVTSKNDTIKCFQEKASRDTSYWEGICDEYDKEIEELKASQSAKLGD